MRHRIVAPLLLALATNAQYGLAFHNDIDPEEDAAEQHDVFWRKEQFPDWVLDPELCRSKSGRVCDPDAVLGALDIAKLEHKLVKNTLSTQHICREQRGSADVVFSLALLRKVRLVILSPKSRFV